MDNHETIAWLKGIKDKYIHGGDEEYDNKRKEAIDNAIIAVQGKRPKGAWVKETPLRETCPFCKTIKSDYRHVYCGVCGADLRGDDNG